MPEPERRKPSPEELLRRVEAEESHKKRGRLKVFLGYASGVGKSFRMLDEGRRRKLRGEDVVVAATQPDGQNEVEELLRGFEIIPARAGLEGPAIDVAAVKRRRPAVCLIDGLAYRNPPNCENAERWQDVADLLSSGISVITTINLQFIREKQPQVEAIRGKAVTESVPESFLRLADDIEVVDAPPEYCVDRVGGEDAGTNAENLQRQLSELREIALVLTADVVDAHLDEYLRRHGIEQSYGTQERILVCVTPRSNADVMIRRGRRQADRFHGDLFVAYVEQPGLSAAEQDTIRHSLESARNAKAHVAVLSGEDPVDAILHFARKEGITQIFVGHSQRKSFWKWFLPNPVERLILESSGIDIRIFPQEGSSPRTGSVT
jgi:two-component system, OmpR family, sensor histidine kinase KdpD